jgi:dTDP-4-amino-4,6-dideoxygalactose transaminase
MVFKKRYVPFYNPDITITDIVSCLGLKNSPEKLQYELQNFFGIHNVMLTGSGRCALKIALQGLNVSTGDEVILPPFICPSVGDAVLEVGGIPVFGDNDLLSFNMSPESVEEAISDKTKAIVIAHIGGIPARINKFTELSKTYNIPLIEDCAQSFGAKYDGVYTGLHGDLAFISFGISKNINGIGGGALFSQRKPGFLRERELPPSSVISTMKKYFMLFSTPLLFGETSGIFFNDILSKISKNRYEIDNFHDYCKNIQNIEAAIAFRKLHIFTETQKWRNEIATLYRDKLHGRVDFLSIEKRSEPSFLYFPLLLPDNIRVKAMKKKLSESGIQSKDKDEMRYFALWKHKKFENYKHYGENVLDIDERYLLLPLGHTVEITNAICSEIIQNL